MPRDFSIAIPAFNDPPELLGEVLDTALAGSADERIVVVDMSAAPNLRGVCEARERVDYDHYPESGGVSHSRNRCAELATTRRIAFLDSDALATPGWLDPLAERLDEPDVAVVGSRILPEWEHRPGPLMRSVTASDWFSLFDLGDQSLEVPRIMGTSYAVDLERVPDPPFDESTGRRPGWPLAMEENVLCESARANGFRVLYEPRSAVRHHIPADRATWRWMWRRAHTAGRETRLAGKSEPIPRAALGLADHAFRAMVALPFLAGRLRPLADRDSTGT